MFKAVVGHSNDPDSLSAVEEVIQQCVSFLAGDIPKAGILFAAIDFEHSLILQQIHHYAISFKFDFMLKNIKNACLLMSKQAYL